MGLESATYIDELVVSNPTGLDEVNKGDDHLRLIKSVLINSLGNISGAVLTNDVELNLLTGLLAEASELNILDGATLTTAELNYVTGVTSPIQDQLDALVLFVDNLFPVGHILHTANSANPATYGYPGTWTQISQGRTIIGEGTGAGLTTRVLDTEYGQEDAIIPSHSHSITQNNHSHGLKGGGNDDDGGPRPPGGDNNGNMQATQGAQANITINSTGEAVGDKNMQPSVAKYIFERTL